MTPSSEDLAALLVRVEAGDTRRCPFDGPNNLLPSDPCPVCGETGEFEDENSTGAACVSTSWVLLQREIAALLKALIVQSSESGEGNRSSVARVDMTPPSGASDSQKGH